MKMILKLMITLSLGVVLALAAFNLWGFVSLGTLVPSAEPVIDSTANRVVMVFGATGSAGDSLLKAAIEDPEVEKIYVVSRRSSKRIDAGVAAGRVELRLQQDFKDYSGLKDVLAEVNTVLWGLGTSSLNMEEALYRTINVDFPLAFVDAWLAARTTAPMAFHYISGMGTDGDAQWALDKSYTERRVAELARGTGLRSFHYRSAFIRPAAEQASNLHYVAELLLAPGGLVIAGKDLGGAMLEISARSQELANGTLIDNADSIAYAKAYRQRVGD